jgi:GNAT superfamily N-acetyltransferase
MDEEALKYAFELFKKDGYNGSIEEYQGLINQNEEAFQYSYDLFKKDGYNGESNDFKSLIGLTDVSQNTQPTQEVVEPLKKKGTANTTSVSELSELGTSQQTQVGVSEQPTSNNQPPKFRIPTEQDDLEMQRQGFIAPPSESFVERKTLFESATIKIKEDFNKPKSDNVFDLESNVPKEVIKQPTENIESTKFRIPTEKDDLQVLGISKVDRDYENKEIEEAIIQNDLLLQDPYLYYSGYNTSSNNQNEKDSFIPENYGEENLKEIGVNIEDFDGFLNKKGYKNDFRSREEAGVFSESSSSLEGRNSGNANFALAKEIEQERLLNLYLSERDKRLNLSIELGIKKDNINKNDVFAKKTPLPTIGSTEFDQEKIKEKKKEIFPVLSLKREEKLAKEKATYEEYKKGEDGIGFLIDKSLESAGKTLSKRVDGFASTIAQTIGLSDLSLNIKSNITENDYIEETSRSVVNASGKKIKFNGTDYLVDSQGQVYDSDLKIRVTDLIDPFQYEELVKKANEEGEDDYIFSTQGAIIETSGVVADLGFQILVSRGFTNAVSGLSTAAKLNQAFNIGSKTFQVSAKTEILTASFIAQSTLGYASGLQDTYTLAKSQGLNDRESESIAQEAANNMAVLYGLTSFISPQTKAQEAIFGASTRKSLIKKGLDEYSKKGFVGFKEFFKRETLELGKKAVVFLEEGAKESVQENIQQVSEKRFVNSRINERLGVKAAPTETTKDEVITTTVLSFLAGGLMPLMKRPNWTKNNTSEHLKILATLSNGDADIDTITAKLVSEGDYTQQEVNDLKQDINVFKKHINTLPKKTKPKNALEIMRKLEELDVLQAEKKSVNPVFHEEINGRIKTVIDDINKLYNDNPKEESSSETTTEEDLGGAFQTASNISDNVEDLGDVMGGGAVSIKEGGSSLIITENEGNINVESISTEKGQQGQGSARALMTKLTNEADNQNKTVELKVVPLNTDTSPEQLVTFYESLGFVKEDGFELDGGKMVRQPQQTTRQQQAINRVGETNDTYFDELENEEEALSRLESQIDPNKDRQSEIERIAEEHTNSYLEYLEENGESEKLSDTAFVQSFKEEAIKSLSNTTENNLDVIGKQYEYVNPITNETLIGEIFFDGEEVVFTDGEKEFSLGFKNDINEQGELGAKEVKPVFEITKDGNINYNGDSFEKGEVILQEGGVRSIKTDKNGNVKRVVITDSKGNTRSLRGEEANQLAELIFLEKTLNGELERKLDTDANAKQIIEQGVDRATKEVAESKTNRNTKKPLPKRNNRQGERTAELGSRVDDNGNPITEEQFLLEQNKVDPNEINNEGDVLNTANILKKADKDIKLEETEDGSRMVGGTVALREKIEDKNKRQSISKPTKIKWLPNVLRLFHVTKNANKIIKENSFKNRERNVDSPIDGVYFTNDSRWSETKEGEESRFGTGKEILSVNIQNEGLVYFDNLEDFQSFLKENGLPSDGRSIESDQLETLRKKGVKAILLKTDFASQTGNELIVIDESIIKNISKSKESDVFTEIPKSAYNMSPLEISKAYYNAKSNGNNPELVNEVESILSKNNEAAPQADTTPNADVRPTTEPSQQQGQDNAVKPTVEPTASTAEVTKNPIVRKKFGNEVLDVELKNGEVVVTNSFNKDKKVSRKNKKAAIKEYIAQNNFDNQQYTETESSDPSVNSRQISDESSNPSEVALQIQVQEQAEKEGIVDTDQVSNEAKQNAIAETFKIFRFKKVDLKDGTKGYEVVDLSQGYKGGQKPSVTMGTIIEEAQRALDSNTSQETDAMSVQATGFDGSDRVVSEDDIRDFVNDFTSGTDYLNQVKKEQTTESSEAQSLKEKFTELTGLEATSDNIDAVSNTSNNEQASQEQAPQEDVSEDIEDDGLPFQTNDPNKIDADPIISKEELREQLQQLIPNGLAEQVVILNGDAATDAKLAEIGVDKAQTQSASNNGVTITPNGFVHNRIVYLNSDKVKADTAIHEFGHLWNSYMNENHKEVFDTGVKLMEGTTYLEDVENNTAYDHLSEEGKKEEALAQAIGDKGAKILGEAKKKSFANWFNVLFKRIANGIRLSNIQPTRLANLNLKQFTDLAAAEILAGKNITGKDTKAIKDARTRKDVAPSNSIQSVIEKEEAVNNAKQKVVDAYETKQKTEDGVKKALQDYIDESLSAAQATEARKPELKRLVDIVADAKTDTNYLRAIESIDKIIEKLDEKYNTSKTEAQKVRDEAKKASRDSKTDAKKRKKVIQDYLSKVVDNKFLSDINFNDIKSIQSLIDNSTNENMSETISKIDDLAVKLETKYNERKARNDEKRRKAQEKIRDKKADIKEVQKIVLAYINDAIDNNFMGNATPAETKRLIRKAKFEGKKTGTDVEKKEALQKVLDEVVEIDLGVKNKGLRRDIKSIIDKPKKYLAKLNGKNKAKTIDNSTRKVIITIKDNYKKSSEDVQREINSLGADLSETDIDTFVGLNIALEIAKARETELAYKETKSLELLTITVSQNTDIVETLEDLLKQGRSRLTEQVRTEAQRLLEITNEAKEDTKNRNGNKTKIQIQQEQFNKKNNFFNKLAERFSGVTNINLAKSSTFSFEYLLGYIDTKSSQGLGRMYKRFYSGENGLLQKDNNFKADTRKLQQNIKSSIEGLLGKKFNNIYTNFMQSKDLNKIRETKIVLNEDAGLGTGTFSLSYNQGLYINLISKMEAQNEQLRRQGWDDTSFKQLEDFLGKEYLGVSDYVTKLLEDQYSKYNQTHLELLRTDLGFEKGYFPTKYDGLDLAYEINLGGNNFSLASVMPSNIKQKVKNNNRIDVSQNAFDVLNVYLDSMERFHHYGRFIKDLNSVINNKEFKNNVKGYDEKAYSDLVKLSKAIVGDKSEFQTGETEQGLYNLNSAIASGYILFKGWTALKQFLSMPAYTEFADMLQVGNYKIPVVNKILFGLKMGANINPISIVKNHRFFLKNSVAYAERMKRGDLGDEFVKELFNSGKGKQTKREKRKYSKKIPSFMEKAFKNFAAIGITPNKLIDAITISSGGRTYYNQQYKKYKKNGVSEQKAKEQAIRDMEVGFLITQQSSDVGNLSVVQVRKGALTALFLPFKNAQLGYFRRINANKNNVVRRFSNDKQRLIENGLTNAKANRQAFLNTVNKAETVEDISNILLYTHVLPLIWQYVASGLPGLLTEWDDEDTEELKRAAYLGSIDGLFIISDLASYTYNKLVLKKRWGFSEAILLSEIETTVLAMYEASKETGYMSTGVLLEIGKAYLKTKSIQTATFENIYEGAEKAIIEEGSLSEKVFKSLNAPKVLSESDDNKATGNSSRRRTRPSRNRPTR